MIDPQRHELAIALVQTTSLVRIFRMMHPNDSEWVRNVVRILMVIDTELGLITTELQHSGVGRASLRRFINHVG